MGSAGDEQGRDLNRTVNDHVLSKRIASVGWGLFLVWVGVVLLADLPGGAGLAGVGIVTLGIQGARSFFSLPLEGFWIVAGAIFTASGAVKLAGPDFPLLPFLLVAGGVILVFLGVRGKGGGVAEKPSDNAG